jgi:hypothetical protein
MGDHSDGLIMSHARDLAAIYDLENASFADACLSPQGKNPILQPICLCPSAVLPTAYTAAEAAPHPASTF